MNKQLLTNIITNFSNLPMVKQVLLLVGLAASIAIGMSVSMWSFEPSLRPLFTNINIDEASQIIEQLDKSGITYRFDHKTNTILVDQSSIHEIKMKLATAGLPKSQHFGFEMLKNEGGLGVSNFMEVAKYKYALENELTRTISSFKNIKSARVHLAVPKSSSFVRKIEQAKASVFIDTHNGETISDDQVNAIVHLVASSVQGMTSEDVTVVDQQGKLLTGDLGATGIQLANKQIKHKQSVEAFYVKKITDILIPILGPTSVKARVDATIDFTSTEETSESYNPEAAVVRSEHTIEENKGNDSVKGGIPGARSNQPHDREIGRSSEEKININDSVKQVTKNYELDKTISHKQNSPGKIKKLSVAVVVDNITSLDPQTNKAVTIPLTNEELQNIELIVRNAIGFDEERGDSVKVINKAFVKLPEIETVPQSSMVESGWIVSLLKQSGAFLIILVLVLGVLRPAFKNLSQISNHNTNTSKSVLTSNPDTQILPSSIRDDGDKVGAVKNLAVNHPERIANIMKNWIENS